jgi:hypothetical protein
MRWEALFEDLQGQWDAAQRADDDARIADLTELEMGRTRLVDRLRARVSAPLTLRLTDGSEITGVVLDAAPEWLLLRGGERRIIVPTRAVGLAWPLGPVAPEPGLVERRLGIAHVLRAVAREGATVRLRTRAGDLRGRIVRIGGDHLDVAVDQHVSSGNAGSVTVALPALMAIEST